MSSLKAQQLVSHELVQMRQAVILLSRVGAHMAAEVGQLRSALTRVAKIVHAGESMDGVDLREVPDLTPLGRRSWSPVPAAILAVLQESPCALTPKAIHAALHQRGIMGKYRSMTTHLTRMARGGEIVRMPLGTYTVTAVTPAHVVS